MRQTADRIKLTLNTNYIYLKKITFIRLPGSLKMHFCLIKY